MEKLRGVTEAGFKRLAQTFEQNSAEIAKRQREIIEKLITNIGSELALCEEYANMNPPDFIPLDDLHEAALRMQEILAEVVYSHDYE